MACALGVFFGDMFFRQNVSGWRDEDKTGGHYRDYFSAATSYAISNYRGESGITGVTGEGNTEQGVNDFSIEMSDGKIDSLKERE